jgi:hypothetical protein
MSVIVAAAATMDYVYVGKLHAHVDMKSDMSPVCVRSYLAAREHD